MVLVDDKKYACESCIKGHRSSGCQHTDRPLFEVKRKGRPVSQCGKCRELRKTKRMHSKCTCSSTSASGPSTELTDTSPSEILVLKPKARRFKPIAPALPNGLKDILRVDRDARADRAVNACGCSGVDASVCTCGQERAAPALDPRPSNPPGISGLAALAQAAAFCCSKDAAPPSNHAVVASHETAVPVDTTTRKHVRNCCSSTANSRSSSPKLKRPKHTDVPPPAQSHSHGSYRPIASSASQYSSGEVPPPAYPSISLFSAVTYGADPGCCCGFDCACPGCTQHRGAQHASKDYGDCSEGDCGTCVDNEGGIALPEHLLAYSQGGFASSSRAVLAAPPIIPNTSSTFASAPTASSSSHASASSASPPRRQRTESVSCIDAFFATAAALPAPPPGRTGALDPTDVRMYPRGIFAGDPGARSLFGLVEVPKLQCSCPGGCGCPEGQCACGDGCMGCAPGHAEDGEVASVLEDSVGLGTQEGLAGVVVPRGQVGSCCSR